MDQLTQYADVVADVAAELSARVAQAESAGIEADRIVLDPGLGFAKESDHNWALLRGLSELQAMGFPLLIGASRKRFLGSLLTDSSGAPRPVDARDMATDAITALSAAIGVWAVRVHDVNGSADAVRVAQAWTLGGEPPTSGGH